uniref:Uncharacterized protein n=1 Tax=Rangifer tarandus platyrhynchus TaxID=3082113 RepID=A0ACB0DWQ7_RANTA|nr:unnamed protein product [Rangifer tarandus platyrhynchus]
MCIVNSGPGPFPARPRGLRALQARAQKRGPEGTSPSGPHSPRAPAVPPAGPRRRRASQRLLGHPDVPAPVMLSVHAQRGLHVQRLDGASLEGWEAPARARQARA